MKSYLKRIKDNNNDGKTEIKDEKNIKYTSRN